MMNITIKYAVGDKFVQGEKLEWRQVRDDGYPRMASTAKAARRCTSTPIRPTGTSTKG